MGAKSFKELHHSDDVREIMNSCARSARTVTTANDVSGLSYSRSARSYSNMKSVSDLEVEEANIKISDLRENQP